MHFMLQTNSLDDVGVARDICLEKGLEISQIGRHPNDQMVSFYVTTPSGFSWSTAGERSNCRRTAGRRKPTA